MRTDPSLQHLDVHAQIPVCRPGRHHQAIRHGEAAPAPGVHRQVSLGRAGRKAQRHQPAGPAEAHTRPGAGAGPPSTRPRACRAAALHPRSVHARQAGQRRGDPQSRPPAARRPGPAEDQDHQDSHRDEPAQAPRPCSRLQIRLQNTWQEARKIISGPLACTFVAGAGFEPATSGLWRHTTRVFHVSGVPSRLTDQDASQVAVSRRLLRLPRPARSR
jgi:hypothetical protein